MKAPLVRISMLIESVSLSNIRDPHAKYLQGALWEIRLKGSDGIDPALYVTAESEQAVIVRAFIKKTHKTPRREIELALKQGQRRLRHDDDP